MIENTAEFSLRELKEIFPEGVFHNFPEDFSAKGISTDTRTLKSGNIFVALRGENFDGHSKIPDAIKSGASAVIGEKKWASGAKNGVFDELSTEFSTFPQLYVENSLNALGKIASFHRKKFSIPVVAIAGAAGKTSTKEMTAHLLSEKFSTHFTHGNFNNQVGVPMVLLQLDASHEAAVIEIGTNEPGEIKILSEILAPTHGLITNIGKEHLEKLINLDGVEKEETALFAWLAENEGTMLVNADDERLRKYSSKKKISFGMNHPADVRAHVTFNELLQPCMEISYGERKISAQLQTLGEVTAKNALCAATVGFALGLSDEEIIRGLESYVTGEGHGYARMRLEKHGGIPVINDCYNANPESMLAALVTLKNFPVTGKRIAVLGDMRELGDSAHEEHVEIVRHALDAAEEIFLLGEEMKKAAEKFPAEKKLFCCDKNACAAKLKEISTENDVILIKGSRGMKMEEILAGIGAREPVSR